MNNSSNTKSDISILLVEDSETSVILIRDIFMDMYDIRVAVSARDAYNLLEKQLPDIILLDLMLPDIDGYTVLSNLKSRPNTKNIPVIIITAVRDDEGYDKAMELGAADYIEKPIFEEDLRTRIANIADSLNH